MECSVKCIGGAEQGGELITAEYQFEVVWVGLGVVPIPFFRVDIRAASQGVRLLSLFSWLETDK